MANVEISKTVVKCNVGGCLNPQFSEYRQLFRTIAEERSIIRRDALNFANYRVLLHLQNPNEHGLPDIMTRQFWSHLYRIVTRPSADPRGYYVTFDTEMQADFNAFDRLRRDDRTGDYLYDVPMFNNLHGHLANKFEEEVLANVKVHLTRNIKVYLRRVITGFLKQHKKEHVGAKYSVSDEVDKWLKIIIDRSRMPGNEIFQEMSPVAHLELRNFFMRRYTEFGTIFRNESILVVGDSAYATENYARCLQYFDALLTFVKDNPDLQIKTWSLLPIAANGVAYFNLSEGPGFFQLFQYADSMDYPIPRIAQNRRGRLLTGLDFKNKYKDDNFKNQVWNSIFKLDTVLKGKVTGPNAKYTLGYGADTDGHMIAFLLVKRTTGTKNLVPDSLEGLAFVPPNIDVGDWTNGFLELKKKPVGLRETDRVVGIDPGVRDLITVATGDVTRENRKNSTWSISNAHYQERCGTKWQRRQELKSRAKADIQPVYDQMLSPKTNVVNEFEDYIVSIAETRKRVFDFNKTYKHREIRGHLYANRQATQAHITDTIAGINPTTTQMPFKLHHNKNSTVEKQRRREKRLSVNHEKPTARTVVAYGDATINSSMKGHAPLPQKSIQMNIARKSIVVRTDEFRTSKKCSTCGTTLGLLHQPERAMECAHKKRKKYVKLEGKGRRKPTWYCLDDEFQTLHKVDECPDRVAQRYHKQIWALKYCAACSDNNSDMIWNRDVNASINMRNNIMLPYIQSGGDIESRAEFLKRKRDD